MGYTIDIDTGGTFTDGFFVTGNRCEMVKVPTTPHDLTICFLECIKTGASRFGIAVEGLLYETDVIRFSNTIGTNTIIQRDGSKVGLLVTAGRENLAPVGNGRQPILEADMVIGIKETVSLEGAAIKIPDEKVALAAAQTLIDRGARCLVVAFANSEFNPAHERLVRRVIKQEYPNDYLGSLPVFLSSDVSSRSGEADRINAAVLNAYIHAKLVRLLYKAGEDLRQRLYRKNLFIVHNNGTVARVSKTRAINTLNSGPTAGLLGARLIGRLYDVDDLISIDMGGTSLDIGHVRRGQASFTLTPDIEGFPVNLPMFAIRAIGAGGGSIAALKGDTLRVGPRSAGALPGPVCFDLGGAEPTVTDADLVLGVLDPGYFLGGTIQLNRDKARAAIKEQVAKPLKLGVEEAALAIREKINETMGKEIMRLKETEWPEGNPLLVVYGGAGPAHCCHVAKIVGLRKIVITPYSAVFSAFSSSSMDVGHVYYRRVTLPLQENAQWNVLGDHVNAMRNEAERDMRGEGFTASQVNYSLELYLRTGGAGQEIRIVADPDLHEDPDKTREVIKRAHKALTGEDSPSAGGAALTMVSLKAWAEVARHTFHRVPVGGGTIEHARKGTRRLFLDATAGFQDAPVYDRARLTHGHAGEGPMLIESDQTTILVLPGWKMQVDEYNNLFLEDMS